MLNSLFDGHITVEEISAAYPHDARISVLRLDKLHPVVSGNKWFKLRFYLEEAIRTKKKGLLTFGGAWSNHIVATAAACQRSGLSSVGIIRGEAPAEWSQSLTDAKQAGMHLHFISRTAYREKKIPEDINMDTSHYIVVPEGGYGETGVLGASTILEIPDQTYTHYICAAGTGTMAAGLINAAQKESQVVAISALKGNHSLEQMISKQLRPAHARWTSFHHYHEGGYARHSPRLIGFMNEFYDSTGIPTDFVYTGKTFLAVKDLLEQSFFPKGSRLLIIHSGGLQGNRSLPKGTLNF